MSSGNEDNPKREKAEAMVEQETSIIKAPGVLDALTSPQVEQDVMAQLKLKEIKKVILDLTDCVVIVDDGIQMLAKLTLAAQELGKELMSMHEHTSPVGLKINVTGLD